MPTPKEIVELVARFEQHREAYTSGICKAMDSRCRAAERDFGEGGELAQWSREAIVR